jgi:hypothetical protein
MIDDQILNDYGSNTEAIRAVFTCEDPKDAKYTTRKAIEKRLSSRLFNGWTNSLANSHLYSAADLAWDAAPIVKENIPLLLYAQKKIQIDRCATELGRLGCSDHFVRKNEDGTIKEIDLPRLYETSVNLVRSYLTRRIAPQATKYSNLFPFFEYVPRATDLIGKLRGDALSQRVEIMADQYNYRHLMTQVIRDILLYGRSILFPACAWDREVQWRKAPVNPAFAGSAYQIEAKVVREGVDFIRPHLSRVFWDMQYPLSSINTNTGASYVGFWDLRKYIDIQNNADYFNRDKIRVSTSGRDFYSNNQLYFDSQFNAQRIKFSTLAELRNVDPAAGNDILAVAPYYQGTDADESLFVTEYYERIVPNQNSMGKYPFPVWMRLVVASDDTIVFGEFLTTSTPAIYFGFNENDNRAMNISMAHEIMPFQDQISNLLSQLLLTAKTNAFKLITLDTDAVDENVRKSLKDALKADKYYVTPILMEYSGNRVRNLGVNAVDPVKIVEKQGSDDITGYFRSIAQLLSIIERMMVLSPQELGQAAPREISATEVNAIASTTSTVYDFISDSIDEGRSAWKKFIYEALVNKATSEIDVPVTARYPDTVVQAAGFTPVQGQVDPNSAQLRVTGDKEKLIHDYAFTTRDGSDRPSNSQSANTLVQLLSATVNIPGVLQAMGKTKLYEIINEIFRLSGAGYDLKLEMAPGEDPSFGPNPQDVQAELQQIAQEVQKQGQSLAQTQQAVEAATQESESTKQQLDQVVAALSQQIDLAVDKVDATHDLHQQQMKQMRQGSGGGMAPVVINNAPTQPGEMMPGVAGVPAASGLPTPIPVGQM